MSLKKVIEEYLAMKLVPSEQMRDGELEIVKDFIISAYDLDEQEFYDKLNRAYRNHEKTVEYNEKTIAA